MLCDEKWVDPDEDISNGNDLNREVDVLLLDALLVRVQLNIRSVLGEQRASALAAAAEASGDGEVGVVCGCALPGVDLQERDGEGQSGYGDGSGNGKGAGGGGDSSKRDLLIVCEKVGTHNSTRFEDSQRLPLGEWGSRGVFCF